MFYGLTVVATIKLLMVCKRVSIVMTIIVVISVDKSLVVLPRLHFASIALLSKREIEVIALDADPVLVTLIVVTARRRQGLLMSHFRAMRHILFFIYLLSGILKIIPRNCIKHH